MAKVYWTPSVKASASPGDEDHFIFKVTPGLESVYGEPVPFMKYFVEQRGKEDAFVGCPAVLEFYKNMYVIQAPFKFTVEYTNKPVFSNTQHPAAQDVLKYTTIDRVLEQPKGSKPLLSLVPFYIFYANEDVNMELHELYFTPPGHNFSNIPGTFNIGKWIRPMDWTFEIKDPSKPISIERGDALLLVKFVPKDGSKVELVRVLEDDDLTRAVRTCTSIKYFIPKLTFRKMYEIAEPVLKLLRLKKHPVKEQPKCPFSKLFKK